MKKTTLICMAILGMVAISACGDKKPGNEELILGKWALTYECNRWRVSTLTYHHPLSASPPFDEPKL